MQDNCKKVWWADAANESAEEENSASSEQH
jgi:hypothetical protein